MARILKFDDRSWHNWHFTERDVPIAGRYELHRAVTASLSDMRASAKAVQDLIGKAFTDRRRLRAHGATWSFSAAPSVPGGWPLATGYANQLFALPKTHVDPTFSGDHDGLVLCQTGISVAELNMWLEPRGRSLVTSGASNGQTFVGAMSCSTHGSAIDHGAIQSQVRAIQLIPGPDRNLWIEPASRPVTDGRLAGELGATVVRDDRLFAAALVSLGALGVVHAVLIESVPRFLLENHRRRVPAGPELLRAMGSLGDTDFAACNLPGAGGRRPYFFQSVINDHIDKGFAYVTCGYRRDWDPGHNLDYSINPKRSPGYNLATVVANLLDGAPGLTPVITKAVLADQLSPIIGRVGSWGQSFNFTTPRAGTAGASVAAPADRVHDVLAIYHAALKKVGKAPVAFACRYARQSPGNLAFIRWPQSVIADIDGLDNGAARQVMAQAIADLRNARIPHAEHWGKLNQATASSVRDAYGDDLERWLAARVDLLDREGEYVFGSDWLDRLGLSNRQF